MGNRALKKDVQYSLGWKFCLTSMLKMPTVWPESWVALCTVLSSFTYMFSYILPLLMLYFDQRNRKEKRVNCEMFNCETFEEKPASCFKWRDSPKNISNILCAPGKVKMREWEVKVNKMRGWKIIGQTKVWKVKIKAREGKVKMS